MYRHLDAGVLGLLGSTVLTAAEYEQLQYVGFPMQTGYDGYLGPNNLFIANGDIGRFQAGEYVGLEDDVEDIDARLAMLQKVMTSLIKM